MFKKMTKHTCVMQRVASSLSQISSGRLLLNKKPLSSCTLNWPSITFSIDPRSCLTEDKEGNGNTSHSKL